MAKKLHIDTLCIETTRRCNMRCAHCLRGDAQDMDITRDVIDKALDTVRSIGNITFTGGEPALHPEALRYTLESVKKYHIPVDGFYVVTNGKIVPDEFLHAILDWYIYVADNDIEQMSGVALSKDMFHDGIPRENLKLLKALQFFREEDKKTDFHKASLIDEGRARNLELSNKREPDDYTSVLSGDTDGSDAIDYWEKDANGDIQVYEVPVYVCADGNVKIGCDDSYENLRNYAGNVNRRTLYDIIRFLCDQNQDKTHALHRTIAERLVGQDGQQPWDKRRVWKLELSDGNRLSVTRDPYDSLHYGMSHVFDQLLAGETGHAGLSEMAHVCAVLLQDYDKHLKEG